LKDFAVKIRGGKESACYRDAGDCTAAQALIEAARRSAKRKGQSIRVDSGPNRAR
jgi:hypothetical protein